MQIIPPALERLIADLSRLPGIGRKTATRLALYILRRPATDARNLAGDLLHLHEMIHLCSQCHTFSETDPCAICGNPDRDPRLVCVVEEPGDQIAIEKTGAFRGVYHILHGVIAPMEGIGPGELKLAELMQRVGNGGVEEVLIATSSTVAGEATASYVATCSRGGDYASVAWPAAFPWVWISNMPMNTPSHAPSPRGNR